MVLMGGVLERVPTYLTDGGDPSVEEAVRMARFTHRPVLLREAIEWLRVTPGGAYVDCTVGEGGHSLAILQAAMPGGRLLGIDLDPMALNVAAGRLASYDGAYSLVKASYASLKEVAAQTRVTSVDGILLDLGISSLQLSAEGRGFSFRRDDPLDMRFDPDGAVDAANVVNTCTEAELENILSSYGEERMSRAISKAIVRQRPVRTTRELGDLVTRVARGRRGRIHPATRSFQALRIAVNRELDNLTEVLPQIVSLLKPNGRLVVISYHSLEDRIVKSFFASQQKAAALKILTRKVLVPSYDEVKVNPRSRSARLRAAERL